MNERIAASIHSAVEMATLITTSDDIGRVADAISARILAITADDPQELMYITAAAVIALGAAMRASEDVAATVQRIALTTYKARGTI